MTDFMAFDATSHPIIRAEDDYNNILDHAWWRGIGWYIRINGVYYEAINRQTGNIDYGGSGNVGAIDGTDAGAVITAALAAAGALITGTGYGAIVDLGNQHFPLTSKISLPIAGHGVVLRGDNAGLAGSATLGDHLIELDNSGGVATQNFSYRLSGLRLWPAERNPAYYSIYIDGNSGHLLWIDHCDVGWNGITIKDMSMVYLSDSRIVDTANEALVLNNVSYSFVDNLLCDNVGGYGDVGAYVGVKIHNGSHKLHVNNLHLYGEKGVGGGQSHGLNIAVSGSSEFSNMYIEGFEGSSILIESTTHLSLTNFTLLGADGSGVAMVPLYGDCKDITIANFDITPGVAVDQGGILTYATNTYDCTDISIANGVIHDSGVTGLGIYLGTDGGADLVRRVTATNVIFDTLNFGFAEKGGCDVDYNQCVNCVMLNAVASPVSLVGSHTRVRNVMGYRNEHAGVATMANATATLDIDPGFHALIDFTATAPIVTLAGQHAEVLDLIWAVKDADEITVTSQAVTTGDRLFNYYIAMPEVFRL